MESRQLKGLANELLAHISNRDPELAAGLVVVLKEFESEQYEKRL